MKMLSSFKLGFRKKSAPQRVEICRRVITAFQKTPDPHQQYLRVPVLNAKLAKADEALRLIPLLRAELRAALRQRDTSVSELCEQVTRSANGHAGAVKFDPIEMMAGGLQLAAPWQRLPPPEEPKLFQATRCTQTGAVLLRWKRPTRRCIFMIEITTDSKGAKGWKAIQSCTAQKCVVENLEPGRLHWFRVFAVTPRGQSPYTLPMALRPG